jgi:hypothetical protein
MSAALVARQRLAYDLSETSIEGRGQSLKCHG